MKPSAEHLLQMGLGYPRKIQEGRVEASLKNTMNQNSRFFNINPYIKVTGCMSVCLCVCDKGSH